LSNREEIERYLLNWMSFSKEKREEQEKQPPPVVLRLRKAKSEKPPIAA